MTGPACFLKCVSLSIQISLQTYDVAQSSRLERPHSGDLGACFCDRPPAASKAIVDRVGTLGRTITLDMIAVPASQ